MTPHPQELEDVLRTLAARWQARGAGDEILGCLEARPAVHRIECCTPRLSAAEHTHNPCYEGLLHAQLGVAYWSEGQSAPAIQHLERAAQLFRFNDHWSEAVVRLLAGRMHAHTGNTTEASRRYVETLSLLTSADPLRQKALAWQAELAGRLRATRQIDAPRPAADARKARDLRDAGRVFDREEEYALASEEYRAAINLIDDCWAPHLAAECYELLGTAQAKLRHWDEAVLAYKAAKRMYAQANRPSSVRRVEKLRQQAIQQSGAAELPLDAEEAGPADGQSAVAPVAPAAPSAPPMMGVSLPLVITRARRQELYDLGYPREAVNKMTPAEADVIVRELRIYAKPQAAPSPAEIPEPESSAPEPPTDAETTRALAAPVEEEPPTAATEPPSAAAEAAPPAETEMVASTEAEAAAPTPATPELTGELPEEVAAAPAAETITEPPSEAQPQTAADGPADGGPVELPPAEPIHRDGFIFPRVRLAPVCAEKVPAGTAFGARATINTHLEAAGIEIDGKPYSRLRILNGERRLRLQSFDLALIVGGESMTPELLPGDCVLVKKGAILGDGSIVAVRFKGASEDGFTIKRYYRYDDYVLLSPDNEAYESYVLVETEALREELRRYYAGQLKGGLKVRLIRDAVIEGVVVAVLAPDPA